MKKCLNCKFGKPEPSPAIGDFNNWQECFSPKRFAVDHSNKRFITCWEYKCSFWETKHE